jgi:hypothetical protein
MGSCGLQIILIFGGIAIQKLRDTGWVLLKLSERDSRLLELSNEYKMVHPPIINSK